MTLGRGDFQAFARKCALYAFHEWMGINPFTQTLLNPCVHSRFQTAEERREQKRLDESQHELARFFSVIERSKRRDRTKRIGRNICLLINHIAAEESRDEHRRIFQESTALKADAVRQAEELNNAAREKLELERALLMAGEYMMTLEEQTDKLSSLIDEERFKAEAAEAWRQVAVASLRSAWENEKLQWEKALQTFDGMLQHKQAELMEMRSLADDAVEYIEWLEQKVADLEHDASRYSRV